MGYSCLLFEYREKSNDLRISFNFFLTPFHQHSFW
jgi:hypothetical protein